jgi:ribosomal protein S18 acetylase RimI-like enzyme
MAMVPGVRVEIVNPLQIRSSELEGFVALVVFGGAAEPLGLEGRVRACHLLAFGRIDDAVVGVAAVKNPLGSYVKGITKKSGYAIPPGARELGYVATAENFRGRGIARMVCEHLAGIYGQALFATTSQPAMQRILRGLGFAGIGLSWKSQRDRGARMELWVRDMRMT